MELIVTADDFGYFHSFRVIYIVIHQIEMIQLYIASKKELLQERVFLYKI